MAAGKEIRGKIKSVENTRKITKAMEMVSTSKMRKAQERMRAARPYGSKGLAFLNRMGAQVVSHAVQLGDTPRLEKLIGPIKVLLDAYAKGELRQVYLCYTRFINTMQQEPVVEQLLPLKRMEQDQSEQRAAVLARAGDEAQEAGKQGGWSYIYEPDAQTVIDDLLVRYVESLIYQAVAENMASEQSARTVAMKAASDNAKNVIDEFTLLYNKTRQAAITKELSEIVAGAAAV